MPIELYIWSGAFAFVAVSGVGLFILSRDPEKPINRIFCLFALAVAGWSVGSFFANVIPDPTVALWTMRVNYFCGVWVPALYLKFIYALSAKDSPAKRTKSVIFFVCSVIFSILVFTPYFIPALKKMADYAFLMSQPGPAYYFFFGFFSLAMAEVIFQTISGLRQRVGLEFRQFKFVAAANVLAILAGFEYFMRVFGFFSSPPLDDYILVFYSIVLAYAVTRHRLFDVDTLVRAFRKERLATLGLLASSINHEIKNPLFVIRGLLDDCLENKTGEVSIPAKTESALKKVYAQVDRISQVIARINRLAKDDEGKKRSCEIASLEEALNAAWEVVSLVKNEKEIVLHREFSANLPGLRISPGEMEEVLINLFANAYDAIQSAGQVHVRAEEKKKSVQIEISDNGRGIDQSHMCQMFKPFFTTKKDKGVGLGLYLTKEIVERRGGRIRVKPAKPSGACFMIELPAA